MKRKSFMFWASAALSAGLMELPFPLAGPMPAWRSLLAWFALVPLLSALLPPAGDAARPGSLRRAFLVGYLCGILWYGGNCYWIYYTMLLHGGLPPLASALILLAFSLYLGLYFGLFGLGVALVRRGSGSRRMALIAAPFLWIAIDLATARITSFPWDQLGYSQIDNGLLTQLAPWTGVYGITFLLLVANALLAGGLVLERRHRPLLWGAAGLLLATCGSAGLLFNQPLPAASATAVLVQPNLDVSGQNNWAGPEWDRQIAVFNRLAAEQCKTYLLGLPVSDAHTGEIICPPYPTHPDLVVWPESPAPYFENDTRFQQAMRQVAQSGQAPMVVGSVGVEISPEDGMLQGYNSALVFAPDGARVGRYDKIHLVPFGEYVPFRNLLFFAHQLTGKVGESGRGVDRKVFRLSTQNGQAHRYGIFICYESVFADEVRQFAQLGAEVLVNISDDGWYGDTSAPWQHLNMARMRAIENRRWILRDTNSGVTASIDPYGHVRQSIPRHAADALPAAYGFRGDITFYTAHGDVFAWACAILALGAVAGSLRLRLRYRVHAKSGRKS